MKINKVPFFENTSDETHCVQACYRMILKYFEPKKDFTWKELEKITKKAPGMNTWPMAGLIWFVENGYEVEYVELFDFERFIIDGKRYLDKRYGKEIADSADKKSIIKDEQEVSKVFIKKVKQINKTPNLQNIKDYIDNDFLVCVTVNYRGLHNQEGFAGHAINVIGYYNDGLIINDPGLPGRSNYKITSDQFIKAWSYPTTEENNITAIRLNERRTKG